METVQTANLLPHLSPLKTSPEVELMETTFERRCCVAQQLKTSPEVELMETSGVTRKICPVGKAQNFSGS